MKTPTNLFNLSFITLGWIVFILLCYFSFKEEKENILATMKENLHETVSIDYQERLNKVLVGYRPLGRKLKGVQIECESGIETIFFKDSTYESLATRLANQYVMAKVIPVNPDEFNEIFKKEWEKNGGSATKTGIIYCHNKKKIFSGNDSISFQSALVTPIQTIDAKKTIGVQAWAIIHWIEIVKHTTQKVLWSIIAYFIVLLWISLSFLVKQQKKDVPTSQDYIQLGKMILKLESTKLYIDNQSCPIAPIDFNLLVLFVNAPDYFLTKEDIKNAFWPTDDKPDNKIHNHISTLKSSLKGFPEYQIMTEQKKGYRLVISSNE
ncbi:winged helix-turn-helix domain-containing protein [Phocaeicola sp.]